jgi:hypothetical protein
MNCGGPDSIASLEHATFPVLCIDIFERITKASYYPVVSRAMECSSALW